MLLIYEFSAGRSSIIIDAVYFFFTIWSFVNCLIAADGDRSKENIFLIKNYLPIVTAWFPQKTGNDSLIRYCLIFLKNYICITFIF